VVAILSISVNVSTRLLNDECNSAECASAFETTGPNFDSHKAGVSIVGVIIGFLSSNAATYAPWLHLVIVQ